MPLLALIPMLTMGSTTCEDGAPAIAYAIYALFFLRSRWIDLSFAWSRNMAVTSMLLPTFLSSLEHFDYFTDGLFPAQGAVCDDRLTPAFVQAWHQSWAQSLAPIVGMFHFWGVCLIIFLQAAFAQQCTAAGNNLGNHASFDVAGLACSFAVLPLRNNNAEAGLVARTFMVISKVLLENCMQLWIQTSFFALSFETFSDMGRRKVLVSLGLSAMSALAKPIGTFLAAAGADKNPYPDTQVCLLLNAGVGACSIFIVAWSGAKVFFAFKCESHIWNLSSGCVDI